MKRKALINLVFVCTVAFYSMSIFNSIPVMAEILPPGDPGPEAYDIIWAWCPAKQVYQIRCKFSTPNVCYAKWQELCE